MDVRQQAKSSLARFREASGAATRRLASVGHRDWAAHGYIMPAPQRVKWSVLERYGRGVDVWIETGTYLGDTTRFLAERTTRVFSIEPGAELARDAKAKFAGDPHVTIIEGLSEHVLPDVLKSLSGGSVAFWLDGHFSAGVTFQGPADTPIREELAAIEKHLDRFDRVVVLVDDVRCFDPANPEFATYPDRTWLVAWAADRDLQWNIEHDIFIAWN